MEPKELDIALEELEQRLERLRSLYEQYFLGIEKVEPTIARKDVDRRFWILRRTKLRNTARRFRLQLLVQRYNTFQQYWMRVCRQIENGTYSRHVRRAEATFGKEALTVAARRRRTAELRMAETAAAKSSRSAALPSAQKPPEDTEVDRAFDRISVPPPAATQPRPDAVPASTATRPPGEIHTKPTTRLPAIPGKGTERPLTGLPPIPGSIVPAKAAVPGQPPRVITPAEKAALGRHALQDRALPSTAHRASPQPGPAARPAAAQSASSASSASAAALSEQRVRELHAQLNAEKRRLADSSSVSLDSLSKSLQETANKLRTVHGSGKQVDFRVVVKGGKAMVKPVLR